MTGVAAAAAPPLDEVAEAAVAEPPEEMEPLSAASEAVLVGLASFPAPPSSEARALVA